MALIKSSLPQFKQLKFLGKGTYGSVSKVVRVSTGKVYAMKEKQPPLMGDGCDKGCAIMSDDGSFVVGRTEAIYFYEVDGRGPCFAFDGEKKMLLWYRSYLVVVGKDSGDKFKWNSLNIYDLKNKFIAFSEHKFTNVTHLCSEWGAIFVFTKEGTVFVLEEKDTQTKLETLFNKNLYSVAVNLAQSNEMDKQFVVEILTRYGDHEYGKGDYDGAIAQYVKTIGTLEPSYVIRKFLDAQRIHNLTSYLQKLHEENRANADHTTLLLNCYTKLKDVEKLELFLQKEANFDVETAIKVCRQAGYYRHALDLARKFKQHDWYVKIKVEDLKSYADALDYIATLPFEESEKNMTTYGKTLVSAMPENTTRFLQTLCTEYYPIPDPTLRPVSPTTSTIASESNPFLDDLDLPPISFTQAEQAPPEDFIHLFVSQPSWLTIFLEHIIRHQKDFASPHLYDTLLELYLRDSSEYRELQETTEEKALRAKKALDLLKDPDAKYDPDKALVLVKSHDFKEGLLYLLGEKLKLYNEVIQFHMENRDYDDVLRAAKLYGDRDPNLWIQVLSYFAGLDEDCSTEIMEVLGNIDRANLLPPLLVIQILASKPTTTLSVIKDYITRRLDSEKKLILQDQREIRSYREDTEKMKAEIEELKTQARIFQLSKCTLCSGPLDLPAVHFLCMHSFHQRCLNENEKECPFCTPDNRKVFDVKRSLEENANAHDQFFGQLESSSDGFTTAAEYFGRSVFSSTIPSTEDIPESARNPREMLFAGGM